MLGKMLRRYKTYINHERGLAAVMFALMIPAIFAAAGIVVDLSTAYNAKNRLGNALDKAVLAVGSSSGTTQQLTDRFNNFFNANYPVGKYGAPFNVTLTVNGSVMTATASAAVPTTFMSIVGINNINVGGTSQVVRTLAGVEAVLVLDTTGSMAGNNIAALKTAATNFINIMFTSISDVRYIKIGIVPWSDNVNVGSYGMGLNPNGSYYGAPFVSTPLTDAYVSPASSITYGPGPLQWGGCVMEPNAAALEQDYTGVNWQMYRYPPPQNNPCQQYGCNQYDCEQQTCTQYNCKTYQCQTYACAQYNCTSYDCEKCPSGYSINGTSCKKGSKTAACTTPGTANNGAQCNTYGNTCVQQGACKTYNNTCQTYYTTSNQCATWTCTIPGSAANGAQCAPGQTNYNVCLQYATSPNTGCTTMPIQPLTNNQTTLLNVINNLPTANNTYSDVGMVWGWRVVSPGFPFQEGASYSDSTWSKTVILMTDGNNTINTTMSGEGAYGAPGTSMSVTDQNNKFEQVCTNMKALGIRIYTITFQSAINASTKQFYRQCATNTSMYYDAPSNADLTTAFQSIATQLSQLHLTK